MVNDIVSVLKNGGVVLLPTDTVYGLEADSTNLEAVNKVFEIKKRDNNKPLLLLVNSLEMAQKCILPPSELEFNLMKNYWPGELTILLKKSDNISDVITAGSEYVGIRIPNNKLLLDIITELGKPIVSTSANLAGEPTINDVDDLSDEVLEKINYVLNDGSVNSSSSTIIKVNNNSIEFLRNGKLTEDIKKRFM